MQFRLIVIFVVVGIISFSMIQNSFAEELIKISIPKGTSIPACEVKSLCYIPDPISVNVGDVVEWTNRDSTPHTVSSGSQKNGADGIIYSGLMHPKEVFAFSFDKSGIFPYFCTIHPWMEGLIVVNPNLIKPVTSNEITEARLSKSGDIIVAILTDIPKARQALPLELKFTDEKNIPIDHMNYDLRIIQDNEDILLQENIHSVDGTSEHSSIILESDNPVQITIGLRGIYLLSEDVKPVSDTMVILISDETVPTNGISPRAQMEQGVLLSNVVCRQGFDLVMKNSDKSAACVTLDSVEKLIARDWASLI
ncbi:MAG: cupredoxin domain-containing protein [Candidatus Nitrosopumilus sp. bin_6a]